jgi:hypothetical protein
MMTGENYLMKDLTSELVGITLRLISLTPSPSSDFTEITNFVCFEVTLCWAMAFLTLLQYLINCRICYHKKIQIWLQNKEFKILVSEAPRNHLHMVYKS